MPENLLSTENVQVVILVGARDFGRCRLASRLNRALWPVFGKPALQRLIEQLMHQGIRRITVCCESQAQEIRTSLVLPPDLQVRFFEDTFPRGPAGGIRDMIDPIDDVPIIVFSACTVTLPDVNGLLALHTQAQSEVTIFGMSESDTLFPRNQTQIYICQPSIFDYIPEKGYFDMKEGLFPALVKDGKTIYSCGLAAPVISYTNWSEYLFALRYLLVERPFCEPVEGFSNWNNRTDVWIGSNVQISPTAKIIGPAVIGSNSTIADKTVMFGPLFIGRDVCIGSGSIVDESVFWDRSMAGSKCRIRNSLIDYDRAIPGNTAVSGQLKSTPETSIQKIKNAARQRRIETQLKYHLSDQGIDEKYVTLSELFRKTAGGIMGAVLSVLVLAVLIITYWNPTLKDLWRIWMQSDEYSSGLLVPIVACYILWLRRKVFLNRQIRPNLTGLFLLAAIQCFRYWSMYYMFDSGERLSFVLSIGALVFFLFGSQVFRQFIPIFIFLFLMLPLPKRIETVAMAPLQMWATISSVFCLETLGYNVIREGNVININGTLVAVAEACNGLRMLTAFVVVNYIVALVVNRKWWEKAIILISSIPIALLCNTIRLTLTSVAFTQLDTRAWEKTFHDFGGLAMMPFAVGVVLLELWLLSKIVVEPKNDTELIITAKRKF